MDVANFGEGSTARLGIKIEEPVGFQGESRNPSFGSDAVVDLLGELGYRYIAINPGSSFRGLHDSLVNYHGNSDPKILLCLHEEVAISLAHGYAKACARPAAAAIHDLVGLMHGSMAVYDAFVDQVPMLILGGSGPRDRFSRRPIDWIHSADTQAELIRQYVKWDDEPSPAGAFVPSVLKAHQIANSAPKGPTYVSLDCALQEEFVGDAEVPHFQVPLYEPAPPIAPDPNTIAKAAAMLCGARLPLIVGGQIAMDSSATSSLVKLVELLGAAYIDDRNVVSFPTKHPNNCTGDLSVFALADIILSVGVRDLPSLMERGNRNSDSHVEEQKIIDLSIGDLGAKSWSNTFAMSRPRTLHLLSDPLRGLEALAQSVSSKLDTFDLASRNNTVQSRVKLIRKSQSSDVLEHWDDRPISQSRLVSELWSAVENIDWLLLLRNTRSWPEGVWNFGGSGEFLGHSGGGGVGYGPGAMVGGALAAAEDGKLGVGIIGDGDFLMASSALWTAVHYGIPMLMVINDNNSFYNDEPHQARVARRRGRPIENSWIGMRISDPEIDLARLAQSYGCWAVGPIDDPSELGPALRDGLDHALGGEVAIVHVHATR